MNAPLSRDEVRRLLDVVGGFDERVAQALAAHIAAMDALAADAYNNLVNAGGISGAAVMDRLAAFGQGAR